MESAKILETVKLIVSICTGRDIATITEHTRLDTIAKSEQKDGIRDAVPRQLAVSFYDDEWDDIKKVGDIIAYARRHRS